MLLNELLSHTSLYLHIVRLYIPCFYLRCGSNCERIYNLGEGGCKCQM